MKKDWTYKKLGEVATAKITDLLWFQEGPGVRKNQYTEDGVKLLNVANLVNGTVDLSTSSRYISEEEAYGKYKHFLVDEGDLIIASSGIQVSYFDKKMGFVTADQLPLCMNTSTIRFKVLDNSITDIKYFMYYLKSYPFKRQLAKYITGSAQLNFGPSHLKQMSMPLYPLAIQRSIVAELDLLHSVISKKKEQLRELDNLAQSLFYQMFGDPITNPMGWEIKKLGEVCVNITDGDHMPPPKSNNGVPFITISNIDKESNQIDFTNTFFVPQIYYDAIKDERKARIGDVLYTVTGSYGIPIIVDDDKPFCFQRHIGLLRPNQDIIIPVYLANWIKSEGGKQQADAKATGIAQKTVSLSSLKTFSLPLPPLSLQQSFAAKVSAIEAQKQAVQQSIREIEALLAERMDNYFG